MNEQEYDELRARFGADHEAWPKDKQQNVALFLASREGEAFLAAEAELDTLLAVDHAVPGDGDAFLSRLMDIPERQARAAAGGGKGFFARLFGGWSARAAIASQAAVYIVVLGVGVAMGMQGGGNEVDTEGVDLSAHLFASNADLYLEEE
ncbi:hypothetical protein [Kordiimonas aestuarii]|uniref:hypothetical protein n=1 Tax=Kordiimonas aestuarii TaxID=1005925 RepID=UPI0021D1E035|nr:hypothetical protein [Kordiimonas aestuarii]